jgi:tetratricopeptide (TPR) repeat protein
LIVFQQMPNNRPNGAALICTAVAGLLLANGFVQAGLYYSGEHVADLPAQWRGFLVDQRNLRVLGVKSASASSPLLEEYQAARRRLESLAEPTANDLADLGAVLLRFDERQRALAILRDASRRHPRHFRVVANLGSAWQANGDLDQAALALQQAVALAPANLKPFEELHLKLVIQRRKQRDDSVRDDLFGIDFTGDDGKFALGRIAEKQRKLLPAGAVAWVQQLSLWLPSDARLLWQLGELANAVGDIRIAASIFEGCVTEFGMKSSELRARRLALRTAAEKLLPASRASDGLANHESHTGIVFRSARALVRRYDLTTLPLPRNDRTNALPWLALTTLELGSKFPLTFPPHLRQFDGKPVSLTGIMQPIGNAQEAASFLLLEFPVGCWFCETPPPNGMILVQMADGKAVPLQRTLVKVEGTLRLNSTDPEEYLFKLQNATLREID